MNVERNIAKLKCGADQQGTALIIDEGHAVTVRHCLKDFYCGKADTITLDIFIDGKVKRIPALPVIDNKDEDKFAYLQLAEKVEPIGKIKFVAYKPSVFEELCMFGYGKDYAVGSWKILKSISREEHVEGMVCDLLLEQNSKDKSYVGYSGSPIFDKDRFCVIGLISQEEDANCEAIYIEGISVRSQKDFFEKHEIPVETMELWGRKVDEKPGTVQSAKFNITGIADTISEIHTTLLQEIIGLHHKGYQSEALAKLKNQIQLQQSNENVSDDVKAKFLLQQALWLLEDSHNISAANKSYNKAMRISKTLDARAFIALRAFYLGEKNARELVKPIDSLYLLNIYMQICVNQGDGEEAIRAYDIYKDIYQYDASTWYIVSIAHLLQRDFFCAEEYINKAIEKDGEVFDFYLARALITYWRIVPEETFYESESICPGLYSNGIYFFTNNMRTAIMDSVEDFKRAYHMADVVGNKESKEAVLACWINAFSIDNVLFSKSKEPLELLRKENPYHVIVLMIDILCSEVSKNEKFECQLSALIRKKKNVIGYILVLIEYYVKIGEKNEAKSLLFEYKETFKNCSSMEYWYKHIAQLEVDKEKRRVYAEAVNAEETFTNSQKKRIVCVLTSDSKADILQQLELLYDETGSTLDLMNVIWNCQKYKNWDKTLKYAQILESKHCNPYGYVYMIKAYIKMHRFNDAYICLQKIEKINIIELDQQIQEDKITVLEKMGEYNRAIIEGEKLFHRQQTEASAHRLANLYIKKGKPSDAIQVLQTVEKKMSLSITGYQRLSGYYRFQDPLKSLEYAKKSVEISNHSLAALSWAANNAAHIGMSNVMGVYWQELMDKYSDSSELRTANLEEIFEMAQVENLHRREIEKKYNHAEIPLHVVLDGIGNILMSEIFYGNWLNGERFSQISFGGHHIDMKYMTVLDKVILDYTSCLLLQEMELLDVLADHVASIYIPSNLYPVIFEEQDKLRSGQSDLLAHRKKVMEYCINTLHLSCVESGLPDNLNEFNIAERVETVCVYTAELNGAIWVDVDRKTEKVTSTNEVYAVLSEFGYPCDYNKNSIRPEKVEMLKKRDHKLLVSILALEEWYDNGILNDISELFEIILFDQEREVIEDEISAQSKRYETYEKLEQLKIVLSRIDSKGKLKWCLDTEQDYQKHIYSSLVVSAITTAIQLNIPYCVEDRRMQSYGRINDVPIYSALDVIIIMHNQKWIDNRKYLNIYREFINKKIGFIILDAQIVVQGLSMSSIKEEKLIESKLLTDIRSYMDQSFYLVEKYSGNYQVGVHPAEKKCYSSKHLLSVREIIEKIWISNMDLEKKQISSDWVIFHYSRYGELLSESSKDNLSTDALIVFPIVQLILQGMLFIHCVDLGTQYSAWLFPLISYYLENNSILLDKVMIYLTKEIYVYLQSDKRGDEALQNRIEQAISYGINNMPGYIKDILLKDQRIYAVYNKFFMNVVPLNEKRYIPSGLFDEWVDEVLEAEENTKIKKNYDGIEFSFSWEYVLPSWPLLTICWNEKDREFSYQSYCKPGVRLYHNQISVRIKEARKIYEYLGTSPNLDMIELLSTENYREASEQLRTYIGICDSYIKQQICSIVEENWFSDEEALHYILPGDVSYFKQLYDYGNCTMCKDREIQSAIPIPISEEYNCGRSLNPVRRLHYLAWIMQEDCKYDGNEYACMFEFLEGGVYAEYGQIYNALLKIVFGAMVEIKKYSIEPIQNRIIWTYIWVDKLYEELIFQIHSKNFSLNKYLNTLCERTNELKQHYDYSEGTDVFDVIDPSQMNLMRLCLLGSVELCLNLDRVKKGEEIHALAKEIEKNLKLWFQTDGALVEFFVSHENAKNEWKTFFSRNYRKELNKLQQLALGVSEDTLPLENNIHELQRILKEDAVSEVDKTIITMECLNRLDSVSVELLESILQKFYIDTDILAKPTDYLLSEFVLLKLPIDFRNQFRKDEIEKLRNTFISDNSKWKKIFDCLLYISGENLELCVEFWEEVADKIDGSIDRGLIEQLARLQLLLPLELGERLYHTRIRMINYKYKV